MIESLIPKKLPQNERLALINRIADNEGVIGYTARERAAFVQEAGIPSGFIVLEGVHRIFAIQLVSTAETADKLPNLIALFERRLKENQSKVSGTLPAAAAGLSPAGEQALQGVMALPASERRLLAGLLLQEVSKDLLAPA